VITRNPRISVSHEGGRTWNLHIKNVETSDKGAYMCQINTATAKTRQGYLAVVGEQRKQKKIYFALSFASMNFDFSLRFMRPGDIWAGETS